MLYSHTLRKQENNLWATAWFLTGHKRKHIISIVSKSIFISTRLPNDSGSQTKILMTSLKIQSLNISNLQGRLVPPEP